MLMMDPGQGSGGLGTWELGLKVCNPKLLDYPAADSTPKILMIHHSA